MSTLTINLNEEYRIKIENGNDFHTSIFEDVYINTAKNVVEIIKQSEGNNDYDDFNNIIAFTGERGKGKSSSMISFRNALINNRNENKHKDFFDAKNLEDKSLNSTFEILRNKKFAEIDIIDPSLFKGNESLFEIILAKMFSKFQEKLKEKDSDISEDVRRSLISNFQKVFENLQIINSDRKELYKFETIEALSKLATSSNLRDCFKDLVTKYLDTFEKKNFLIIAIDDFDLNVSGAYEMLEDIRQFLIQRNIVLLIACKMEQLNEAVKIKYKKKLKYGIKNKSKLYINKLIPFTRRIILPDVQKVNELNLKVLSDNEKIFDSTNSDFNESVIRFIYEKLNIFQTLNKLETNYIIPKTIRETQNFFNIISVDNNIEQFKDYILQGIEDIRYKKLLVQLEETPNNLFLLMSLRIVIKLYTDKNNIDFNSNASLSNLQSQFKRLFNSVNSDKISIGDILFVFNEYENSLKIEEFEEFEFFDTFKLYFILRLSQFKKNKTELLITKYGFVNFFSEILPKENNKYSRDLIYFEGNLDEKLKDFSDNQKFLFSLWVSYLGDGIREYRIDTEKDIFKENYKQGYLSPFSTLNNIYNINELSEIFKFNKNSELINSYVKWFENSKFIKHLYNPSFSSEIFELIREFRKNHIKGAQPVNYFDTISLFFAYGIIYSLDKFETKYKIKGLTEDFINYPLISSMINTFNKKRYTYNIVNELNDKYSLLGIDINESISDSTISLINILFDEYKTTIDGGKKIPTEVTNSLIGLLKLINSNQKFTSRKIKNIIDPINKFSTSDDVKEIITKINSIKYEFNSKDPSKVTKAKEELIKYLQNIING